MLAGCFRHMLMPCLDSMPKRLMPAQPAAFFASDGYYNTAPGSTLSLVIQPNYYSATVRALSFALPPLICAAPSPSRTLCCIVTPAMCSSCWQFWDRQFGVRDPVCRT